MEGGRVRAPGTRRVGEWAGIDAERRWVAAGALSGAGRRRAAGSVGTALPGPAGDETETADMSRSPARP